MNGQPLPDQAPLREAPPGTNPTRRHPRSHGVRSHKEANELARRAVGTGGTSSDDPDASSKLTDKAEGSRPRAIR